MVAAAYEDEDNDKAGGQGSDIERVDDGKRTRAIRWLAGAGYLACVLSFLLWIALIWYNPYDPTSSRATAEITFGMLALPACLFAVGLRLRRTSILLAAFIWSVPIGLYMLGSPSFFALFGVSSMMYGLIAVLFRANGVRY